jgi:hypothetical protein
VRGRLFRLSRSLPLLTLFLAARSREGEERGSGVRPAGVTPLLGPFSSQTYQDQSTVVAAATAESAWKWQSKRGKFFLVGRELMPTVPPPRQPRPTG